MKGSGVMPGIKGGVAYYPDHWPQEEWKRDLSLIKESGLEYIRFGEFSWNWFEPEEGKFEFDQYDVFMDTVAELGLKAVLCTPTAAPPEWLLKKYPDVRMLDQSGKPHHGGRHMACLCHPEFLRIAGNTATELAKHFKNHPALAAWQIDNEPTAGESIEKERMYDYNPHTFRLFTQYLKEKYNNDLSLLNSSWYNNFWSRSYTDWEQTAPPTEPANPSLWLEWMRFRQKYVTDFVQWQLRLLRGVDKNFIIGTNIPECGPVSGAYLGQDYWKQAEGMDYVGTDIYCFARDEYREEKSSGYCCDVIRSAAKYHKSSFWICETQGGPHLSPWKFGFFDGYWDSKFLEKSVYHYADHGAERISFFLWRPVPGGREFGMNGLAGMDGSNTDRITALPGILENACKRVMKSDNSPQTFFHYPSDTFLLAAGFDPDKTANRSYPGWYNLLTDCGMTVEFLNDEALSLKKWEGTELLVLPHTLVMNEMVAGAVRKAESQGIKVLAGYGTGFYNESGCCNRIMPGFGLYADLGFRLKAVDYAEDQYQPEIFGLEGIKIGVHRGVIEKGEASVLALSTGKEPLVLKNRGFYYFAFDLGEVYYKTGMNMSLRNWFAGLIGI